MSVGASPASSMRPHSTRTARLMGRRGRGVNRPPACAAAGERVRSAAEPAKHAVAGWAVAGSVSVFPSVVIGVRIVAAPLLRDHFRHDGRHDAIAADTVVYDY